MGARAAQVEAIERHSVAGQPEHRAPGEPLVEAGLQVHGVPARHPMVVLEVPGQDDLTSQDRRPDAGSHLMERVDDPPEERLALGLRVTLRGSGRC